MTAHHGQALVMCQRVLGRDTGDAVQAAASEVLQNQSIEVGMMRAWLTGWGQSTRLPSTVMGWMGAAAGRGVPLEDMPGLATTEQMRSLSTTQGEDRGRLWLTLMRAHHVGGVAMAEQAVKTGSLEQVIRLATQQAATQSFEIGQYDLLLAGPYS